MITQFSKRIGNYIALQIDNPEQSEVIAYGNEIALRALIKLIIISFISSYLGIFYETLIAASFSAIFRTVSGGVHCTSYTRCMLTSTFIFSLLGLLVKMCISYLPVQPLIFFLALSTCLLLCICMLWIPTGNENRPLTFYNEQRKFKIISLTIIVLHFLISVSLLIFLPTTRLLVFILASTAGLLWQGFTVTPYGYYLINHIDKFLKFRKGGAMNAENY